MNKPAVERRNTLWSIGWYTTFGLLPFGTSLVGFLFLLIDRLSRTMKLMIKREYSFKAEEAPREALWANRLFILITGAVCISGFFSPKPSVALPSAIGFGLLIYVFIFGSQTLIYDLNRVYKRYLPVMIIAGISANIIVLFRYFYLHLPRAVNLFTGFNGLGTILIMIGGVSIGYLQWRGGKWRRLILPYLIITVLALLLSQSRGAWFGFIGMLGCISLFNRKLLIIVLVIIVLAAIIFNASPVLKDRLSSAFSPERNIDRIYIWQSSLKMMRDYPVFGVGAGVFFHLYEAYAMPGSEPWGNIAYAHNIFLNVGTEFGLLGLALFLPLLAIVLYMSFSLAKTGNPFYQGLFAALVGVLIHQQVDVPIWGLGIGGGFWMLSGLVIGLYRYEWLREREAVSL